MVSEDERVPYTFELVDVGFLKPHEEYEESRVVAVARAMQREGLVRVPIVADRGSGVILDGHHRFEALLRLGARRIPVAFVDYTDPRIVVEAWRSNERPPTKEEVLAAARAGRRYPPKSTRHRALHTLAANPASLADLR